MLKSIFILTLFSCSQNLPAQDEVKTKINNSVNSSDAEPKEAPIICGADQIDKILEIIEGKNIGIVANQTSRVGATHLVDTLWSLKAGIQKVFSPEHGFRGDADAGEKVASDKDAKTGLPIVSLYGNNKKPKDEQVQGLDIILFDLQDVGVRFYTYISTLHYVMETAAENGVKVVVLDRPNPNGSYVDGPIRKKGFESFISLDPLPVVHGMTVGELAQMMNGEKWLENGVQCELEVVPCLNYNREMAYSLPVPPSPNLRSDESIQLYPSLCFFEGTVLSVGRGTTTPFEIFGHPDLKEKEDYDYSFTPVSSYGAKNPKLENKECFGLNLHNYAQTEPIKELKLEWIIDAYKALNRSDFFISSFNLLAGTDELKKQIISGMSIEEIRDSWKEEVEEFKEKRKGYLLYE